MFQYEFMTQSQLGKIFGVSSHIIGKWLADIGLRTTTGKPSHDAFQGGFVEQSPSRNEGYSWSWQAEKTVAALEATGHYRIHNPPADLVDPPRLSGPFSLRKLEDGTNQFVSADGSVAIIVTGDRNAALVRKILNTAHLAGVIEKHLAASAG